MENQCCDNCHYFLRRVMIADSVNRYSGSVNQCNLHNLLKGEITHPKEQKCDSWYSKIAKNRYDKLIKLGLNENENSK